MGMDREPHVERWWALETKCQGRDGLQATEALLLGNLIFPSHYLAPNTHMCTSPTKGGLHLCWSVLPGKDTVLSLSFSFFFFFCKSVAAKMSKLPECGTVITACPTFFHYRK